MTDTDNVSLTSELTTILNRHSRENASDSPDFVLAEFMIGCLAAYEKAVNERDRWQGRPKWSPGGAP